MAETTTTHLAPVLDVTPVLAGYRAHLEQAALAPLSRRSYARRVGAYLEWLAARPEHVGALEDPRARDWAVRDYRGALKDVKRAPATINGALAAVDDLYRYLGLGPASAKRETIPQGAPRGLSDAQLRRLLRALEARRRPRDRALVALMAFGGLRVAEVAGLEVGDVAITARTGTVRVRRGKGDVERAVPLPKEARGAVAAWIAGRPKGPGPALFAGPTGEPLSVRAMHRAVAGAGRAAGMDLSPHALRHTYVTRLVRQGVDLATVAELAGHRRLETTRRYARPSEEDRQAAVELLELDY